MITYFWESFTYCCFGKPIKLVDRIKDDIAYLTDHELDSIRACLLRPLKDKSYCC